MHKIITFCMLLFCIQSYSQTLEDAIYNQLDQFIENPNRNSLQQLEEKETTFSKQVKTNNELLALVILNANMGYYQKQFGNHQKAIHSYEKAWKIYKENQLDSYDIIEYCLKPLGNLYTITGDFANAENTIKTYLSLSEKQNNRTQIIAAIINLSVVYHNTAKHQTAIAILQEGLKTTGLNKDQKSALENNLATNLIALKQFETAQILLENQDNFLSLRNKAQLALKQGDTDKASSLLDQAEKLMAKNPPLARDLARFYVDKAALYAVKKEPTKATENYQKALQILLPTASISTNPNKVLLYAENTFISIFDGLAQLQENPIQSLNYFDLSFYIASLLQEQYTTQEVKIIHQAAWKKRTEQCLEILYNHYVKTQDKQLIERAFSYAEKSKAPILQESILKKSLLESYPEDSLLLERAQLSSLQEQKTNELIREQLTNPNSEKIQTLIDTISGLHRTLKDLQTKISQKYPNALTSEVSLNDIQSKIKEDHAVLISYFFGKEALYRFEITKNERRFFKTNLDKNLTNLIAGFIGYFESSSAINNDITGFQQTAFSLYNLLLPETSEPNKNLIIIPDGLLLFIPFESLLTAITQSTSFATMPFLIKQNPVIYNTSASLYHNAQTPKGNNSVLGLFPVFENSSQPLTFSLEEAKNINNLMPTHLLMHQEASKNNFLALAKEYSILHLSTHAYSGDYTIPAALELYDEVMLLQEFYSLNLNPKLVVLSACETGIGKIQTGEGAMSLARGFQYAGAQNLLFSLWKVNDRSTSQLMTSFYEHYSKTNSAYKANQNSKLDLLENENISNANKSPYYWSGFVYYGALDAVQEKYIFPWWIVGFIGLVILLWGFKNGQV